MEQMEHSEGNTRTLQNKPKKHRKWCFTLFNYTEHDINTMKNYFKSPTKYMFGVEICPTTGKKHLQGYVELRIQEPGMV